MYIGAVSFPWSGLLITGPYREPIARNKAGDVQTCKDYSWSCIMNFSLYNVHLQYSVMAYQCNSCLYSILEDMATCHHSPRSMVYAQFSLVFVPLWQSIGFAVMDERVVAVAPRKGLGSDPQMWIGVKLGSTVLLYVMVVFLFLLETVVGSQHAQRYGHEQWDVAPCVSKTNSMVMFGLQILCEGARRTSPSSLDTS